MELTKKSIIINQLVHSGSTELGVDGDIIVPDIKPDILKILQVDGTAVITNQELTDGRLCAEGRVDLKILYIPDREGEKIKSILTSFDFSHRIDKQAITPSMTADLSAEIGRIDFQLVNSRKLRVKSVVELCYEVTANREIEIATDADGDNPMEVRKNTMNLCNMIENTNRDFMLKESMEIPAGQTSIDEILKTDVRISDKEYKVVSGRIVTKGMCNICVLYLDTTGNIKFTELDVPFTEIFDVPDAQEGTVCDIEYTVTDLVCMGEEDNDGDKRIVNVEMAVMAKIRAVEHIQTDIISDCYCPGCETNLLTTDCELDEIIATPSAQLTLRDIAAPGRTSPPIKGIYNVITRSWVENTVVDKDKVSVEGKISCYILYLSDSEESPVYSCKKEIPFSCTMDSEGSCKGMECDIRTDVAHTSYSLNAAGEAEIRCILSVDAKVIQKRTLNLIEDVNVMPLDSEQKKGIVIYFVQKDDTLWDVAKRYYVSQEAIVRLNEIEEDNALEPGVQLVIPSA